MRLSLLGCLCRHAATMDSSSPDSLSSHSPLDTPAGDVRQRLLFDCHESRFGESAEPDPLSFGSPQSAERAQHAQQAEQHDLGAMSSSFQVRSALAMHKTVYKRHIAVHHCSQHLLQHPQASEGFSTCVVMQAE